MLKHIGRHGDRKIVIMFHTVPGEDHMCLLVYSDLLPRMLHDEIMRTLESNAGQTATNLSDALFRVKMSDGRNPLEVLHKESFMKKVQTSQVIMTPTQAASIRLDELNKMLAELATGADAAKRMAELDSQLGLQTKKSNLQERPMPKTSAALVANETDALSDESIAAHQRTQAVRMRSEASSLLAEATRLEAEAAVLSPVAKVSKRGPKVKTDAITSKVGSKTKETTANVEKTKKAKG